MSRKIKLASAFVIILFTMLLFLVVSGLNRTFSRNMDDERKNQLNELTVQVSNTFSSALSFHQSYAVSAKRLLLMGEYDSAENIVTAIDEINRTLDIGDGSILMLIDDNGYCYDADGRKGIWGDFDQLSTGEDRYTFIADSVTYENTHWAFCEKMEDPLRTKSGDVEITYVVLLCPVENLDGYFLSESYNRSGDTYILKENGTRMYDSLKEDDTILSYNVYKTLRASEDGYGESFDSVLETLEKEGVASGIYVQDGKKYCYSLAWHSEYQMVIMYLIPAGQVASNTAGMVKAMTKIMIYTALLLVALLGSTVYVVMKVSSTRALAAQKEESIRELEEMNSRLTAMNESLNSANKATQSALAIAKSANRAKSSFLSNMSHDIRTPLNAILGFQKLLDVSVNSPEKVKEYSEKIALAGNHLLALINDILDMSRIESGKTTLNLVSFDLEKLVDDQKALMATQMQNKHQEFLVENRAGSLMLVGDQARLNQILTNLLSNAVKYTPQGGKVEFLTECLPAASNSRIATIRFIVRDNGVGMEEEFQKRIFEPFTREESALVSGISGTGLGMSITKSLIDLMGGVIMVESRRGEGSTFTVEISFRLAEAGDNDKVEDEEASFDLKSALNGCHFLLAEDTDINAEILTALLEMEGATCDLAHDGKEAVTQFEASAPGTYTAILMDVQMPVMNGYEATKCIRKSTHPQAETIPIAALTANAFAEDVQMALESGMNTHIAKPVDMNKLREFIISLKEPVDNRN